MSKLLSGPLNFFFLIFFIWLSHNPTLYHSESSFPFSFEPTKKNTSKYPAENSKFLQSSQLKQNKQ